jgi:hypothetical protein
MTRRPGRSDGATPSIQHLAEAVLAALQASGADPAAEAPPRTLEAWENALDGQIEAVAEELRAQIAPVRNSLHLWERLCSGLEPLRPAPPDVRQAAASFLDALGKLAQVLQTLSQWRDRRPWRWTETLERLLARVLAQAVDALVQSPCRGRLWPLHDAATAQGLGQVLPPLVELLAGSAGAAAPPEAAGSLEQLCTLQAGITDLAAWCDRLAGDVMRLAAQGLLAAADLEAARAAVRDAPGRWALAHRQALRRAGFTAAVYLVRDDRGEWAAPRTLWLRWEDLQPSAAVLPGGLAEAELPAAEQAPGDRPLTPGPPGPPVWLPHAPSIEALALDTRHLPLAEARLWIFADEAGLWVAAQREGPPGQSLFLGARCPVESRQPCGDEAQMPLVVVGEPGARLDRGFRPGPLRDVLGGVDRAYSPRAYVVTVGESLLRRLLGWSRPGEGTERVARAAARAGLQTYAELREALLCGAAPGQFPAAWLDRAELPLPWIAALESADGSATLGSRVGAWSELAAPSLGAEIDTLAALEEHPDPRIRPVDGDLFVLVPTETATSVLAALLVGRWLHERFPRAELRLEVSSALRQADPLQTPDGRFQGRHPDPGTEALAEVYRMGRALADRLLVLDASDPILVLPGGVRWQTMPMLELGWSRRLPCVYKFEPEPGGRSVQPVVFRWDKVGRGLRQEVARALGRFLPLPAGEPCLVVNVGISLLAGYRRQKGVSSDHVPAEQELVEWVRVLPEAERWRRSLELSGIEAWRRRRQQARPMVALLGTASPQGRLCRFSLETLLQMDLGIPVLHRSDWEVMDLAEVVEPEMEQHLQIFNGILQPFVSCLAHLRANRRQPELLATSGQTFTIGLMQAVARGLGLACWLSPERSEEQHEPVLWEAPQGEG